MKASDVLALFEQYTDDNTELSSGQELILLQKKFNQVWNDRPWEFTKATASGTFGLTIPHIPKPSDFSNFIENNGYTDNTASVDNNAAQKVIFVGSSYAPYQIINWSDRRQYRNTSGYAYLDLPNSGITFTVTPVAADTYEFDYKKQPPTLVLGNEIPFVPAEFHDVFYHLMAVDDDIILRFPKAQSYAAENAAAAKSILDDMALWNASLLND